jgi:predicted alpha/beta superfamily hydrolase
MTVAGTMGGILAMAFMIAPAVAQQPCVKQSSTVPPSANTTKPDAPFYVDVHYLNLSTTPPTRDPANPDFPAATSLPDGQLPSSDAVGNFTIGPTHPAAPEAASHADVPKGKTYTFTMSSSDSVIYNPGIVRDDPPHCFDGSTNVAATAPGDPSYLLLTTSHPGTWTRTVIVYVPAMKPAGDGVPFMVVGDGPGIAPALFTVLDNMINEKRIPPIVAVAIGPGGQDAQGSERGREYDTVSGEYAEWVEQEVLPLVEKTIGFRLTRDPDGRATMGVSSSGAAAFTMAWFHPDYYHRVLAYSPTFLNQQWPHNPALPGGAWEFHSPYTGPSKPGLNVVGFAEPATSTQPSATPLVLQSKQRPIRFWFETGDRDAFNFNPVMPDGMHDLTIGDEHMAKALAAKGYQYQFLFSKNAGHVDRPTMAQTLPLALEWVWKGYSPNRIDR